MVTRSGCAGGRVVVRVGVGDGEDERVGDARVGVGVGDGLWPVRVGVGPVGVGVVGVGEVVALLVALLASGANHASQMRGMANRAPMTKNTAAMTTLGNCIAFLPAGRPPVRTRARSLS
ncbi:hypothetical protein [Actinomadura viridis]|uniref:Uncharacterized protein n=1 Tax=Actinomadura viridis TaxID=58110 RepID=A0A931DD85_9ACTN|nr:hypothetical protein [Actinomadura viridis]MBG6086977.1 hypothetical protein [Actinomadura viridis]